MNSSAHKQERIKFRILVPLILAIGILLTTFGLAIQAEQRRASEQSLRRTALSVQGLLKDDQQRYTDTMELAIQTLLNDDRLADALRDQNREALLNRTKTLFDNLKRVHRVTHFYFHSPERTNLLRVHNPARYGDRIDGVVLAAEKSGRMASGLEKGRLGAYAQRVASPWVRDGRLLGYVELGVNFEDVIKSIHKELDVDLFVAADKALLDRRLWYDALRQASWNQFPHAVVMDKTATAVPKVVRDYLERSPKDLAGMAEVVHSPGIVNEILFLPLHDARGTTSAQLIVLRDITAAVAQTRNSLMTIVLVCLPVSAALIIFFYSFLGRIEHKLEERTAKLEAEITERQAAQKELHDANERLEERVKQRTQELTTAIAELHDQIARREGAQKELLAAQKQLLEASHQAGMAEVATSVLHNVGNVLNSVNVSSSLIINQIRRSKVANLGKAVSLLRAHEGDLAAFLAQDPKGRQLPAYLEQLAKYLIEEQGQVLQELDGLGRNVEHINEIVAMQQSYAKVSGLLESLPVTDLVEDALRLNATSLESHQIRVVREYSPVPPILLDKHKVLQILVNLVTNAKHALVEHGQEQKALTVRVTDGDGRVRISVTDNGVGIPPENLTRIFNYGFTTRKDGHGFGLHSGALAAKELGGSLSLASDGLGKGTTATLELPCPPATN